MTAGATPKRRSSAKVQVVQEQHAGPWKCGSEFLPYHPSASHGPPDYRDGWNQCYAAAQHAQHAQHAQQPVATLHVDGSFVHVEWHIQAPTACHMQVFQATAAWQPQFDVMSPKQEVLVQQFCAEIAGPKGEPGRPPDPVRLLEMAQALYEAEREECGP